MSWVAAGTAAVAGTEAIIGGIKAHKAKQQAEAQAKNRPKYDVSPYAKDQLSLAESEVSNGMGAEAKNAYEQDTDRDLSTSLDAILKGGGSVNNVGEVFDKSQQGRQRFAAMKESLRLSNINNLMSAYGNMSAQGDKQFEFNTWAPWADKTQAVGQERKSGQDMMWSGVSSLSSSLGPAINGIAGMFKGSGSGVNTSALPSNSVGNGGSLSTGGFNPGQSSAFSSQPVGNNDMPDLNLYNITGPTS